MNRVKLLSVLFLLSIGHLYSQSVVWTDSIPFPTPSSGKVMRVNLPSRYVDQRPVDVWLPDGYPNGGPYNVLYMHDGQMLYDETISWNKQAWKVDEVLGGLMKEKKVSNTIVVGVFNNGEKRRIEYIPQKALDFIPEKTQADLFSHMKSANPEADNYLKFLVNELKPFIDANYNVYTDKEHTFVMGSSMGGLISMYAICEYPSVFGGAACLSTHWIGIFSDNETIPNAFMSYMAKNLPNPKTNKIYFDTGDETLDAFYPKYQKMVDKLMEENGFSSSSWQTLYFKGANHSEEAWNSRLDKPLMFLMGKK